MYKTDETFSLIPGSGIQHINLFTLHIF